MLTLINDSLFNYKIINEKIDDTKSQVKLLITNADKVKQPPANDNYEAFPDDESLGMYKPLIKVLAKITAPDINYDFYRAHKDTEGVVTRNDLSFQHPTMSFKVNEANEIKKVPTVEIRFYDHTKEDYVDRSIYMIAVPFNGIMKSIPESPDYRIYKGCLVYSPLPIYFKKKSYKKVLYLVLEPNMKIFEPDHKYHKNSIDLDFTSFYSYTDPKSKENKTDKQVYHINITKFGYTESWENSTLEGFVAPVAPTGTQLWTTFRFNKKDTKVSNDKPAYNKPRFSINTNNNKSYNNGNNRNNKGGFNNNKKQSYVKNNTLITTNKHGIRKEVSLNKISNSNNIRTTSGYNNKSQYNNNKPNNGRARYVKDGE